MHISGRIFCFCLFSCKKKQKTIQLESIFTKVGIIIAYLFYHIYAKSVSIKKTMTFNTVFQVKNI